MEYKNILFPLHTFKDNRMEIPSINIEYRVETVSNNDNSINKVIELMIGWQVVSLTVYKDDAVGTNVIILFQRMITGNAKPIEDY